MVKRVFYLPKRDIQTDNILSKEEQITFDKVKQKDTDCDQIISEAKQYPFGADYRVVLVKEAQHLYKIELLEN